MHWREVRERDLPQCIALDERGAGDALIGRQSALGVWKTLFQSPCFHCALIETSNDPAVTEVVGFGASIFLDRAYGEIEIADPQPDITSRTFAALAAGKDVLQPEDGLVCRQRPHGLDLLLLCSSFSLDSLSPDQQMEAAMLLPQALVHLHVGYRIDRILMETTNERMRLLAVASGAWRSVAHFPQHDRALFAVSGAGPQGVAGFGLLDALFHHRAPLLHLRDTEKQLLAQAMHGQTDAELARLLHLSVSSVKKRWTTLFERIAVVQPNLLPKEEPAQQREGRGSQKRHRILAYIREHPEEIRPFRWYPNRPEGSAPDC